MSGRIRGVIFDHSTILVNKTRLLEEVRSLLEWIKERDLHFVVFSTHDKDISQELSKRNLPPCDLFLTKISVGAAKGSPSWIKRVCTTLSLQPHELLYVGDDQLDWRTAINSAVFYLHAEWVEPLTSNMQALTVRSPSDVRLFASHFLLLPPRFEYAYDAPDEGLYIRALLNSNTVLHASEPKQFTLQDIFTHEKTVNVGGYSADTLLMTHAISSLYLEGLIPPNPYFAIYPSSEPGKVSSILARFTQAAAPYFHGYLKTDMIIRGIAARNTSIARARKEQVDITEQANTVWLNNRYLSKDHWLNRTIIVFDDFTTMGFSLDWARNLLQAAGVPRLILLSVGKYGKNHPLIHLRHDPILPIQVMPFNQGKFKPDDFEVNRIELSQNKAGRELVIRSFELFRSNQPF